MRKVVIHAAGSYEALRIETHPDPMPGRGEVRVRVRAAGINYADCIVRMGLYASAKEYVGWPITPGFEVAGQIDAHGEGAGELPVGTPVFGVTRFGGYAEAITLPEAQVRPLPGGFSFEEAAAFPTTHLTAWYALRELVRLRPGKCVLVHSAAGGVGTALVRIAKHHGAFVVGVVGGAHKVELASACGADHVIDKRSQPLWTRARELAPDGYHVVLDANGTETLKQSYRHLAPTGALVVYGFHTMLPRSGGRPRWGKLAVDWLRMPRFDPLQLTGDNKSVLAFNLSYLFDEQDLLQEALGELLSLVDAGVLPPPPVRSWPLERVADAHAALESGETTGKLALTM